MNLKAMLMVLACLGGSLWLTGCETMEGAGRDVENAGDAIEDAAD